MIDVFNGFDGTYEIEFDTPGGMVVTETGHWINVIVTREQVEELIRQLDACLTASNQVTAK